MFDWVTCPSCGHKLFRVDGSNIMDGWGSACFIEIKCHSCKQLIFVNVDRHSHTKKVYKREGRKINNVDSK